MRRRSPGRDGRGHQIHGDKRSSRDRGMLRCLHRVICFSGAWFFDVFKISSRFRCSTGVLSCRSRPLSLRYLSKLFDLVGVLVNKFAGRSRSRSPTRRRQSSRSLSAARSPSHNRR